MKRILLFVALIAASITMKAQQDPQFTQWFNDKLSFNPASAGINNAHCLSAFYRTQWTGLEGQPKTAMFNYSGKVGTKLGVGLNFYNDQLGQETNNVVKLSGAYHMPAGNGAQFSAGISLGFYGKQLGNDWRPIDQGDNTIPNNGVNDNAFDLGLGVYYWKQDKYYVGLSSTHLTAADMEQLNIGVARHYFFMGGYNFDLNTSTPLVLRTNLLAKSDFNKTALDVNVNVLYDGFLYGGLTYRPGDAIAPVVGVEYCQAKEKGGNQCFKLGYSYDVTTSNLSNYSNGSHEIFLSYCFTIVNIVEINKHSNPRFL